MNDKYLIKTIVHISLAIVLLEMVGKISHPNSQYWIAGGALFLVSYTLCIVTDVFGLSSCSFVKHNFFRSTLSLMHGLDGLAALMIGLAIRFKSLTWLTIGLMIMTKFFLIHLLNRMILAKKKTDNFYDGLTQTTKSFLHHTASFLFLQHPNEIIITTVWRTISMTGHAALVLRDKLSHKSMHNCHWGLAYVRIAFQISLLWMCYASASLRSEFGASAVGHIAYMAVRLEPVFQQGSMYLDADEKQEWLLLTGSEKMRFLLSGGHPWLALELVLLSTLIVLFATLRVQLLINGEASTTGLSVTPDVPDVFFSSKGETGLQDSLPDALRWFFGTLAN